MKKTKIITLCGSSRFCDIMAVCAWLLERDEKVITMGLHLLPIWYPAQKDHQAEHEGVANEMDKLHFGKIDISDEIFVVNRDDYIGDSTSNEIKHAESKGLPIRFYTHDVIGDKCEKIIEEFLKRKNTEPPHPNLN